MATEETKPVEREAFNKFLASRKMGHNDVLILLIEDVWQASADAAMERAAQECNRLAKAAQKVSDDGVPLKHTIAAFCDARDAILALKGSR